MVLHFTGLLCMTAGSTTLTTIPVCLRVAGHTFYAIMLQLILNFHMPYVKKVLEEVSFSSQVCITHRKCSLHTDILQVKLKILHPKCFLSDHLPCRCLQCKVYPLTCPTSKNSLFHHQKHSGDNWKNCLHSGLLDCLAQRGDALS